MELHHLTEYLRNTRFGSPLVLSRIHWVRPEWSSRSAMPNGPRMVCSGTSSIGRARGQAGPRRAKGPSLGGLFGGVDEVASNPTKPPSAEDIVQTQSYIRELTKVSEREVHEVVLV